MIDRIVNTDVPADDPAESELESTLRPRDFSNYIGQERIKQNILLAIVTVTPSLIAVLTWGNTALAFISNFIALVLVTGLIWTGTVWVLKTPLRDELALLLRHVKSWRAGTSDQTRS